MDRPTQPTQKDVADKAGVSQAVVSRVYGKGYVSKKTRALVLESAKAIGYQPDAIARSLATGRTGIVGVVMGDITNPFYPYVLDRITRRLQERNKQALLFNVGDYADLDEVLPMVLQYRVEGLIITSATLSSKMAQVCREMGTPVVLFNRYSKSRDTLAVSCDNVEGGRLVANTLLAMGHQRIGYIGGLANTSTNEDRKKGFTDRLLEHGVSPVFSCDGEYSYDSGYERGVSFLKAHPVDAVFCANDIVALGLMDAARTELGLRIPEDLSVIGFDDIPDAARAHYRLTTVKQPVDEMIETMFKLLEADKAKPTIKLISGVMMHRASVKQR